MRERGSEIPLTRKAAETGFAIVLMCFGAAIVTGALELETGWSGSGPEAGYFPFRIGVLIIVAAAGVLIIERFRASTGAVLLNRRARGNLVLFALPLLAFIAAIPALGIYIAGATYLLVAIGLVGKQALRVALPVALAAPFILFVLFEFAFRTPLPKGPLAPLLGML